jgi:hypothetical protein
MTAKSKWTAGCDPEFFARDKETHEFVSAIPYVNGTKDKPEPLPNGGFLMKDNVAVEFGVPPASNVDDWVHYITKAKEDTEAVLPDQLEIVAVPSTRFDPKYLLEDEAREAGCEPDYNAWTEDMNEMPEGCMEDVLRSCGGHIHVGCLPLLMDIQDKFEFTKLMDGMHGYVSTVLDSSAEAIERKNLYGKAGCFRPTEYGIEYRTLSNFWCKDEKLMRLIYHLTDDAIHVFENNLQNDLIDELGGEDQIKRVINECEVDTASACIDGIVSKYMSDETLNLYKEINNEN